MIIKCKTLEQVKKIVEIEGWDDWKPNHFEGVADILEEEPVCVDTDGTGYYNRFYYYLDDNPESEITNFEDSKYAEEKGDKMENKIKVRIVTTSGCNWYKIGDEYDVCLEDESSKYYRFCEGRTIAKRHCEIIENESTSMPTPTQIEDAIALLKVSGYTITLPRITEEQAIERIKEENEKIGYVPNWEDDSEEKHFIYYNNSLKRYESYFHYIDNMLRGIYTTKEIAEKICKELNGEVV